MSDQKSSPPVPGNKYKSSAVILGDRGSIQALLNREQGLKFQEADGLIGVGEYKGDEISKKAGLNLRESDTISLQWSLDTLREPTFNTPDNLFHQRNRCFMLVYDAQKQKSFDDISDWFSKPGVEGALKFYGIQLILVGTNYSEETPTTFKMRVDTFASQHMMPSYTFASSLASENISASTPVDGRRQEHDAFVKAAELVFKPAGGGFYPEISHLPGILIGAEDVSLEQVLKEGGVGVLPGGSAVNSFSATEMGRGFSMLMKWATKDDRPFTHRQNHPHIYVFNAQNTVSFTEIQERVRVEKARYGGQRFIMGINYTYTDGAPEVSHETAAEFATANGLQFFATPATPVRDVLAAAAKSLDRPYDKDKMRAMLAAPAKYSFVVGAEHAKSPKKDAENKKQAPDISIPLQIEIAPLSKSQHSSSSLESKSLPDLGIRIHVIRDPETICSGKYKGEEELYWKDAGKSIKTFIASVVEASIPSKSGNFATSKVDDMNDQGYVEFSGLKGHAQACLQYFLEQGYLDSNPEERGKLLQSFGIADPKPQSRPKEIKQGSAPSSAHQSSPVVTQPSEHSSSHQSSETLRKELTESKESPSTDGSSAFAVTQPSGTLSPPSQSVMTPATNRQALTHSVFLPAPVAEDPNRKWKDAGVAALLLLTGTLIGMSVGSRSVCGMGSTPGKLLGGALTGAIITALVLGVGAYMLARHAKSERNTVVAREINVTA